MSISKYITYFKPRYYREPNGDFMVLFSRYVNHRGQMYMGAGACLQSNPLSICGVDPDKGYVKRCKRIRDLSAIPERWLNRLKQYAENH